MSELIQMFLTWIPFIILIAVFVYYMRKVGGTNNRSYIAILEEYLEAMKKNNLVLAEIRDEIREVKERIDK